MGDQLDEATLAELETELGQDAVWVSPALREEVTPAEEREIEQAVAASPTPTFVVLVELPYDDRLTSGDFDQLAGLIHDDTGRDGYYLGLPLDSNDPLEVTAFPEDTGAFYAARLGWFDHPDDVTAQAVETVELLGSGDDLEAAYDQRIDEDPQAAELIQETYFAGSTADDGSTGLWLGLGGGVLALLVIAALVARALRGRRTTPPKAPEGAAGGSDAGFTLPSTVVRAVRDAERQRREERAAGEVQTLGEALDRTPMDAGLVQGHRAWQSALDHYELARRILDRRPSPADVVGAIVLAGRGHEALEAARTGQRWTPSTPCWFNPLHEVSQGSVPWPAPGASDSHEVPVCGTCRQPAEEGRLPDDTLEFVGDGSALPYFRLALGVWSRTGYGALEPDLVTALSEEPGFA